ncbi:hypothetical protein [Yoonia sp. BS5-3]|uniref:Clp protease n=1 Tax=Yoonia phaeophyticola TaxID=3137369 RepID=A0ABZ2V422_9RHOB
MRHIWSLAMGLIVVATDLPAQKFGLAEGGVTGKFDLRGSVLIYNSDNAAVGGYPEIEMADVEELRGYLRSQPHIKTLELNSGGGSVWAGNEMARIVLDFGLNTRVEGECSSSCVNIFLAGQNREMARGSSIGFHQYGWTDEGIESYFKEWRDEENWRTPYDFASWLYQDTQHETAAHLEYMISRGVDPLFAIEAKKYRPAMWYPTRSELEDAGVLRD